MDIRERFESKYMPIITGCWIWMAGIKGAKGKEYGKFWYNGVILETGAHQASYMIYKGSIPNGINVLHKCDVPLCVNPDHLFLGTQMDNVIDMVVKGRQYTRPMPGALNNNAKLTAEQVSEIRKRYMEPRYLLAMEFVVTKESIGNIILGNTWKDENWEGKRIAPFRGIIQ